jgi:AcrR family transcriptional regulator
VYIDFATKQQLFEAMVTHACAIIQDALAKDPSIATSENSPCEMLARSVRQVISAAAHDPAVFLFLEGRLSCATSWLSGVVDAQLPLLEGLSDLIAQAQRNGEIRSDLMPSIGAHLALFPLSIPSLRDLVLDGQIDEASKQTVAMLGCGMA